MIDKSGLIGPVMFAVAATVAISCAIMSDSLCFTSYYRCPSCGASYKQKWYQHGLPGQMQYRCGKCDSRLYECSKEESGWNDELPASINGY